MTLFEAIAARRAVRNFTAATVSRDAIRELIEAAVLAPSARNLQPWSFAVMVDRERIELCAQRAQDWLLKNLSAELDDLKDMLSAPGFSIFYGAPALVLIMATDASTQSAEDCCLAAQNLMLAARARELGTCWIGLARPWLNLPMIRAELGLPETAHVVAPIIVGHPQAWPIDHGRKRPEILWLQ